MIIVFFEEAGKFQLMSSLIFCFILIKKKKNTYTEKKNFLARNIFTHPKKIFT